MAKARIFSLTLLFMLLMAALHTLMFIVYGLLVGGPELALGRLFSTRGHFMFIIPMAFTAAVFIDRALSIEDEGTDGI